MHYTAGYNLKQFRTINKALRKYTFKHTVSEQPTAMTANNDHKACDL